MLGQVWGLGYVFRAETLQHNEVGWGLEKSEWPWKPLFYSAGCVSYGTISLPSFNGL